MSFNGSSTGTTHDWDFNGENSQTGLKNLNYAFKTPGNKVVTYITTINGTKCTSTLNLVVKESPKIKLKLQNLYEQCFEKNLFCFTDSTSNKNGAKITKIKYLVSDGQLFEYTNPTLPQTFCFSVKDERGGSFDLYVEVEDENGCIDTVKLVGAVSVSQLLRLPPNSELTVDALAQPVAFVPETLSGLDLLEQFRKPVERATAHGRLVLVVDEYGVVQGLMTPRDLLEAITGELLQATVTDEPWAMQRDDGSWLIDGLMPVSEFKSRLQIRELPDEDRDIYNTVAGLVMAISGDLPRVGDRVECGEWQLEVVDLDGRRIDKLLVTHFGATAAKL